MYNQNYAKPLQQSQIGRLTFVAGTKKKAEHIKEFGLYYQTRTTCQGLNNFPRWSFNHRNLMYRSVSCRISERNFWVVNPTMRTLRFKNSGSKTINIVVVSSTAWAAQFNDCCHLGLIIPHIGLDILVATGTPCWTHILGSVRSHPLFWA